MVKTLTTNNSNVLNDEVLRPVYFLKFEFPSANVYLNSSDRNITWGGNNILVQVILELYQILRKHLNYKLTELNLP